MRLPGTEALLRLDGGIRFPAAVWMPEQVRMTAKSFHPGVEPVKPGMTRFSPRP
jgi:hypothetical protein